MTSYETDEGPKILVIQTGKMRENHIEKGVDSLAKANKPDGEMYIDPDFVHHRFLPQDLEAKYEAIDFAEKFGLNYQPHFSIFDDAGSNVILHGGNATGFFGWGAPSGESLLDNVNVVVAVGSTSIQAFKLSIDGPICILPMSDTTRFDPRILGDKEDPNLTAEHLARLSTSKDADVANSVLQFIRANTRPPNGAGHGNAVFVNQIGYSILGFNPRGKDAIPHVPTTEQKVVSMRDYEGFTENGGKTGLITVFQEILRKDMETPNNIFVVARQCKAMVGNTEHDISGQWANQAIRLVNEPSLLLSDGVVYDTVVDLGGSSGTSYSLQQSPFCGWIPFATPSKYVRDKYFMKTPSHLDFMKEKGHQPNDFADCVDAFAAEFNRQIENVYDDLTVEDYSTDEN
jgi:hypothetical protein